MVRIPAFHAGGPGSIPGVGTTLAIDKVHILLINLYERYGLTAKSTSIKAGSSASIPGVKASFRA